MNQLNIAAQKAKPRIRFYEAAGEVYAQAVNPATGEDVGQVICGFRFSPEVPGDLIEIVRYGNGTDGFVALANDGKVHISALTTLP